MKTQNKAVFSPLKSCCGQLRHRDPKPRSNRLKSAITGILAIGVILACGLSLDSCSVTKEIPVETDRVYRYIDSLVVSYRDSTVIVPVERIVDIVPQYDTLHLETSMARSEAYVDTTLHMLRGNIENKDTIQYKYKTVYKDRVVEKTDSIYVEVPVEVTKEVTKVPKWSWWTLGWSILTVLIGILAVYLKFIK